MKIAWLVALLTVIAVTAGVLTIVATRYRTLQSAVITACGDGSVVARLDLTEWVEPCLIVRS